MYVLKEPEQVEFEKFGIRGKVFPSWGLTAQVQYFLVETETGHQTTIIEHECDFAYYILEGEGYFEIDGVQEQCSAGDLVVIPQGRQFTYKGRFKMLATSSPPWEDRQEETIL